MRQPRLHAGNKLITVLQSRVFFLFLTWVLAFNITTVGCFLSVPGSTWTYWFGLLWAYLSPSAQPPSRSFASELSRFLSLCASAPSQNRRSPSLNPRCASANCFASFWQLWPFLGLWRAWLSVWCSRSSSPRILSPADGCPALGWLWAHLYSTWIDELVHSGWILCWMSSSSPRLAYQSVRSWWAQSRTSRTPDTECSQSSRVAFYFRCRPGRWLLSSVCSGACGYASWGLGFSWWKELRKVRSSLGLLACQRLPWHWKYQASGRSRPAVECCLTFEVALATPETCPWSLKRSLQHLRQVTPQASLLQWHLNESWSFAEFGRIQHPLTSQVRLHFTVRRRGPMVASTEDWQRQSCS